MNNNADRNIPRLDRLDFEPLPQPVTVMNQTLHILQSTLSYSEERPGTPNLSTIQLLEQSFSHVPSGGRAQSQDEMRPVSQRPRGDWRDNPTPTTWLAVNLSRQQDSEVEPRSEIGEIGQLSVQFAILDKNRPRLLETSPVETRHRINNQQSGSLG